MGSLNVELERRVAERTAELESFSHAVAHDLKTPLRAIDGSAAMLLENEGGRLTMEGKGRLARIRAAAQRGGRLIESLLRLVRLTREPLRPAPFDLSALAGRVAQRLQGADPGRRVVWEIESGLSAVADAGLVEEVLEQLFGNALKFTQRRDPARIAFGEQADGPGDGRRAFYVEDDGAGFDMKHAGELFGPFHRAHTDSEFPGLGIGLAVVERVVRRHGGTVRAEGETGRGARFIFTL
jgi:signal transduction histidine kinase